MLQYFIPLIAAFLNPEFLELWFYPIFALAFIATVPRFIRSLLEG